MDFNGKLEHRLQSVRERRSKATEVQKQSGPVTFRESMSKVHRDLLAGVGGQRDVIDQLWRNATGAKQATVISCDEEKILESV
ncbi:unnamed protein product [Leptosia nina]|uniref:Uncharacterized protein n=1 Tax=Leptosia nina TaxID=320188 RepID=A0AAV1JA97_9NEOP